MAEQFANDAVTTLSTAVTTTPAAGTSETWTVSSTAAPFPQSAQFRIGIDNEICIVTAILNGTQWTVTRGAESSTIATHTAGTSVACVLTEASLQAFVTANAPVTSFNTRTGAISPANGDYSAAQITNAADKSSASTQTFSGIVSAPGLTATQKSQVAIQDILYWMSV